MGRRTLLLALGWAGAAIAAGIGPGAVGVAAADKSVEIWCEGADAVVDDPHAVIYKSGLFKNKRVRWRVRDDQRDLYRWRITWKAVEDGDDYLGPVDEIACGARSTTSQKAPKEPPGRLEWAYAVHAFDCATGEPACYVDPVIWIDP